MRTSWKLTTSISLSETTLKTIEKEKFSQWTELQVMHPAIFFVREVTQSNAICGFTNNGKGPVWLDRTWKEKDWEIWDRKVWGKDTWIEAENEHNVWKSLYCVLMWSWATCNLAPRYSTGAFLGTALSDL